MRILVIVDTQKDFIDGALGSKEAQEMIPNLVNYINETAEYHPDTLVLFTKDTHSPIAEDYFATTEGIHLPVHHCAYKAEGWSIDERISKAVKDGAFYSYSSEDIINGRILKETFGSITLGSILAEVCSNNNVSEIIFTGICTDICVISNALIAKAACPNVEISVKADCCAGTSPDMHNKALEVMSSCLINII